MAERPGVMVYFDDIRPLQRWLSEEDAGALFIAILDYAQYGEVKELPGNASIAFDVLKPHIDKDARTYADKCMKKKHAAYVRWARDRGQPEMDFDEWKEKYGTFTDNSIVDASAFENDALASTKMQVHEKVMHTMPTSTPMSTSTSASISTATSINNSSLIGIGKEKGVQGERKTNKNVIMSKNVEKDVDNSNTSHSISADYQAISERDFEDMRAERIRQLEAYEGT